jgi:hypothetical protein
LPSGDQVKLLMPFRRSPLASAGRTDLALLPSGLISHNVEG